MPRSTRYRSSLALIVGAGLISLILWYASLQDESREHLNSSVWRTLWPCEQGPLGDSKWDCIDRDHASRSRVDVGLQKQQLDDLVAERKIWTNNRAQFQNADNLEYARKCLEEPGSCPPRPLIVSHYLYVELLKAGDPLGGEMVWMESVIEKLEAIGYRLLILRQYHEVVQAARMAGSLIHSYWGDERFVTECVGDPRCIADHQPPYVTTEDEPLPSLPSGLASTEGKQEHWVNLDGKENWEKVPLEERGSLPVQRLFSVQFWPNAPLEQHRADDYQGPSREMAAPNPLGNQWTMTPFPYPGHLFMPWSVEQACHRTPNVPQSERQPRAAIIFAKYTSLFHWHTDPKAWSSEPFVESGIKFYATAKTHPDGELPAGIQNLGPLATDVYSATVAGMRAMIGIGAPKFSPSPYFALCKGVPVVLWRSDDREPRNEWERLLPGLSQHGPVASLGKPYVYEYTGNNATQLLDAVEQAVSNPIEPYIPPVMRDQYVAEHIAAWAENDFEDRLDSWIREHMGRKPRATLMYREKFGLL